MRKKLSCISAYQAVSPERLVEEIEEKTFFLVVV
jgi:hypothetical protein